MSLEKALRIISAVTLLGLAYSCEKERKRGSEEISGFSDVNLIEENEASQSNTLYGVFENNCVDLKGKLVSTYSNKDGEGIILMEVDKGQINTKKFKGSGDRAVFSPDGTNIAYYLTSGYEAGSYKYFIYTMGIDGTGVSKLVENWGVGYWLEWPLTDRIAFSGGSYPYEDGIHFLDPVTGKVINFISEPFSNNTSPHEFSFFPDAQKIVYSGYNQQGNGEDIYILDFNTLEVKNLTNTDGCAEFYPQVSPKGDFILFKTYSCEYEKDKNVHFMDVNSLTKKGIGQCGGCQPLLSPDGTKILLVESNIPISLMDFNGQKEVCTPYTYELNYLNFSKIDDWMY